MSGIPSHSGHTQSYGNYSNWGQHAAEGGIINNQMFDSQPPLGKLEMHCSQSAAFDSAARFDPPRCAESTRLGIIQIIEEWTNSDGDNTTQSSLFWLLGGAGVGKSALAQSLSEKCQEKKNLAASFFFFRSDPTRNNGDQLIPTLVSQLTRSFKAIVPFIEDSIRENSAIFTKRCDIQIRELLIEPLLALKSKGALTAYPRVIVIDGLDECRNPDVQTELLRVIARAIPQIPFPLRFLITSRPEAHITSVFTHDTALQAIAVHRYNLSDDPDADMDIRHFLEKEFAEIRRVHRLGRHLPPAWPGPKVITPLVERSSGHFIYASTVIRYIRSPKHRPDDRLQVILCLQPPQEGDRPYAQLDALYTFIFQGVENQSQLEKICLVLGILYFQSKRVGFCGFSPVTPKNLLEMKAGDLDLLLDPILSLVAIDGDKVRILHKSLFDHLLDSTRSGHLLFDLARVHEVVAIHILKHRILKGLCDELILRHFAYHSQFAHLNDTLNDYLNSLEVPFPESAIHATKSCSEWDEELKKNMQSVVWHIFRTLSHEDFDPTGQAYEHYMGKWTHYFHSAVPRRTKAQSREGVDNLKSQLDRQLMEWNFRVPNFGLIDIVGIDPDRRVAFIKQEHSVFSAYVESFFSSKDALFASSLVFGEHFTHSYNFGLRAKEAYLTFQTYSMRSNTHYQEVCVREQDIVGETQHYLKRLEKYLCSSLYRKYGVKPD